MNEPNDLFNFDQLTLVDKPTSPKNAGTLPQTLEGCEGYLKHWPLRPPNADLKNSKTVAEMVNILTDPSAATEFETGHLKMLQGGAYDDTVRPEGLPPPVYDAQKSSLMQNHLKMAKKRSCHFKAPGVTGHLVLPGCISFYTLDGKTFAVTQGRWLLSSYKALWIAKNVKLDQDMIEVPKSEMLMIRVPPGSVGRIYDQGVEILLDVGAHVFNSGTVLNAGTCRWKDKTNLSHERYHYVRVSRGYLARVWVEVSGDGGNIRQPRLLSEGEHFIDNYLFDYSGMSSISEEYIAHGSVHRVSVQKGFVAKILQDSLPRLLGEGDHVIESTNFSFLGMTSIISNLCIKHETITILRVTLGQIALSWKDNVPTFIDIPGLYEFDSPDFEFVEFKDAEEQLIQLGSKKVVLVHTGQVGVAYDQGKLEILQNGRHIIDSPTFVFHRFLSTQQKSIRLATLPAREKQARSAIQPSKKKSTNALEKTSSSGAQLFLGPDDDLTICETKDLVKVGLRADVFYSIDDPEKCIQKIDTDELEDLVRETAVATLTNIIRSTALNEIAQSKEISAGTGTTLEVLQPPTKDNNLGGATAVFFEKVHDEFLSKLNEDFMDRYGVDIANIRIESFKIMDQELAEQISKHALTTAQIENEMANLEGNSLISTTKEKTAAEVKNICAEADASAQKTESDAANQRKIDAARATAEAEKISILSKAEAEADAIMVKARAEAEAIRLKAAAEAERAKMLSETTLGAQETLLSHYAQMVIESNKGVEKVIYLDPSINRDSPFALGGLQNLNFDLNSLSQLGIAANEAKGHAMVKTS